MASTLYIHTIGFLPKVARPFILDYYLQGYMPDYQLFTHSRDSSIHLVEIGYKRYIIYKNLSKAQDCADSESAIDLYRYLCRNTISLIEMKTTDWGGNVLRYQWSKRFNHTYIDEWMKKQENEKRKNTVKKLNITLYEGIHPYEWMLK